MKEALLSEISIIISFIGYQERILHPLKVIWEKRIINKRLIL